MKAINKYRNHYILYPLVVFLFYGIYTNQLSFMALLALFYLVGFSVLRFLLGTKSGYSFSVYNICISIYGLLTLLTHIELIDGRDPYYAYYIHIDAALSFYTTTIDQMLGLRWSDLLKGSILNPFFADYPLASLLFGFIAKLGALFGVADLRLLLRCHVFVFAAIIPALIVNIQILRGIDGRPAMKQALIFSICSYLFITSAIFSRDLHVTFGYALVGYVALLPSCKFRMLKMLLACIITIGFRPVSGVLAFVFVFGYYASKNKATRFLLIPAVMVLTFIFFRTNEFVEEGLDRIGRYGNAAELQTGGVFGVIYGLPFPLNQMGMIVYMLLMPIPITKYIYIDGGGGSFLTFPFLLSPFLMSFTFICSLWLIFNKSKMKNVDWLIMLSSFFAFVVTVFGSPDLRRSFASIPVLYMIFVTYWNNIPSRVAIMCKKVVWPVITVIELFFFIYQM